MKQNKDEYIIIKKEYLDTVIYSLDVLSSMVVTMNEQMFTIRKYCFELSDYLKTIIDHDDRIRHKVNRKYGWREER